MYGSPSMPAANDLNLAAYPSKPPFAGGHSKEESTSNSSPFAAAGGHQEPQQMNSSLLRYRSAPSSLLAELCDDFLPVRTSCPEPEAAMFARFLASDLQIPGKPPASTAAASTQERPQFAPPHPPAVAVEETGAFSSGSPMNFHSQQKEPNSNSSVECSYPMAAASMAMEMEQMKTVHGGSGAGSSNLVRHSSSPAGLFSYLNADNGYPVLRENPAMGSKASRLKNRISFSSRQNSIMSQIPEAMGTGSSSEESGGGGGGRSYIPGFPGSSWENCSLFSGSNTFTENNGINPAELQNGELLQHQLSLPKTSSEMAAMENYLQFQDAVPCKIRAKRGCATHPRSIAERVRRTRISERIRKLQELVPNMDKQTNTSEMLDLAISYIKDLQKEVKTLKESRSSCTCNTSGKQEAS